MTSRPLFAVLLVLLLGNLSLLVSAHRDIFGERALNQIDQGRRALTQVDQATPQLEDVEPRDHAEAQQLQQLRQTVRKLLKILLKNTKDNKEQVASEINVLQANDRRKLYAIAQELSTVPVSDIAAVLGELLKLDKKAGTLLLGFTLIETTRVDYSGVTTSNLLLAIFTTGSKQESVAIEVGPERTDLFLQATATLITSTDIDIQTRIAVTNQLATSSAAACVGTAAGSDLASAFVRIYQIAIALSAETGCSALAAAQAQATATCGNADTSIYAEGAPQCP